MGQMSERWECRWFHGTGEAALDGIAQFGLLPRSELERRGIRLVHASFRPCHGVFLTNDPTQAINWSRFHTSGLVLCVEPDDVPEPDLWFFTHPASDGRFVTSGMIPADQIRLHLPVLDCPPVTKWRDWKERIAQRTWLEVLDPSPEDLPVIGPRPSLDDRASEIVDRLNDAGWLQLTSPVELGAVLRGLRKEQGYSLRKLADLVCVSPKSISHLEQGKEAHVSTLLRAVSGLGHDLSLVNRRIVSGHQSRFAVSDTREPSDEDAEDLLAAEENLARAVSNGML